MRQDKCDSSLEHIMNTDAESVLTEDMRHALLVSQNDALRSRGEGGRILITSGIAVTVFEQMFVGRMTKRRSTTPRSTGSAEWSPSLRPKVSI